MEDEILKLLKMFLRSLGLIGNLWEREERAYSEYYEEIEDLKLKYGFELMAIHCLKFVLIGSPGSGKSFIMFMLGKLLNKKVISQDDMEENVLAGVALNGKGILHEVYSHQEPLKKAILEEYGEEWFVDLRKSVIKEMIKQDYYDGNILLDTNGKVGISPELVEKLKEEGFKIVYLQMLKEEIFEHFKDEDEINARTNLKEANENGKLEELLCQIADRDPIYQKAADVIVGRGENPMETLEMVIKALYAICEQAVERNSL